MHPASSLKHVTNTSILFSLLVFFFAPCSARTQEILSVQYVLKSSVVPTPPCVARLSYQNGQFTLRSFIFAENSSLFYEMIPDPEKTQIECDSNAYCRVSFTVMKID